MQLYGAFKYFMLGLAAIDTEHCFTIPEISGAVILFSVK
jgi:hypothetical protein